MSEIDLIPLDYQRSRDLRRRMIAAAIAVGAFVVLVASAKVVLWAGISSRGEALNEIETERSFALQERARLDELAGEQERLHKRLTLLEGLRGGITARDMFLILDRALDGNIWFRSWTFRRAGEAVETEPDTVNSGYFIVVPDADDAKPAGWLMQTHMEIHAQAMDHSALAGFVRRLVAQPEIAEVKILNTQVRRFTTGQAVDFELAVVVNTQS